jgi:hypothetical protein
MIIIIVVLALLLMSVGAMALGKAVKFAFTHKFVLDPQATVNISQIAIGVILGAFIAKFALRLIS